MWILLTTIFFLYIVFVTILIVGWQKSERTGLQRRSRNSHPFTSVIIAARNEGSNIGMLLKDLSVQIYPEYEVIVVDDHSEDNTSVIVQDMIRNDIRFKLLSAVDTGKKRALAQGISESKGTIILTTDADCRVNETWLSMMTNCFSDDEVMMVFGGVRMNASTLFEKLQSIEFSSLIGSAAAACAFGRPILCNGANLAFKRKAFDEVGGYNGNFDIASGDDEFLMRKISVAFPASTRFAHTKEAVVTTKPNNDIDQLVNQRIRWAGKWNLHTDYVAKGVALFVLMFQLSVLILFTLTMLGWINTTLAIVLLSLRLAVEMIFINYVMSFLHLSMHIGAFLLLQLIYPVYVCYIAVFCNFKTFSWKGRTLKPATVSEADRGRKSGTIHD